LLIYSITAQLSSLLFITIYLYLVYRMIKDAKTLRAQERIFHPEAFTRPADQKNAKQREYISKVLLFGIPLVHAQFGMPEQDDKPIRGWIAIGSKAHGLLFAWGGLAIAPISIGIVSVGIISLGAVSFGLLSIGTVAVGVIGFGASAIAYKAYAAYAALGWENAFSGGFSIAKDAALGPVSHAAEINNVQASAIGNLDILNLVHPWVLAFITLSVIIPAIWHFYKVKQRMK
jgi:hypothetical protein